MWTSKHIRLSCIIYFFIHFLFLQMYSKKKQAVYISRTVTWVLERKSGKDAMEYAACP